MSLVYGNLRKFAVILPPCNKCLPIPPHPALLQSNKKQCIPEKKYNWERADELDEQVLLEKLKIICTCL